MRYRDRHSDMTLMAAIPIAAAVIFLLGYVGGWHYQVPSWVPTFNISVQPLTDRVHTVVDQNKSAAFFLLAGLIAGLVLITWIAMLLLDLRDGLKRLHRWIMRRPTDVSGILRNDGEDLWSASSQQDSTQTIYRSRLSKHMKDFQD